MVVVVQRVACSRIGVTVPSGLETGEGICKYPHPFLGFKPGERRVNIDQFCAHDGTDFLSSRRVDIDGGAGGNVYSRRPYARMAFVVRSICINPVFRDEFRSPFVRGGRQSSR
jgi:hypothetical protein